MKQYSITRITQVQQLFFVILCLCLGCMACTENDEFGKQAITGDDIRIFASMPEDGVATKSPDQTKKEFVKGDKIHISATFTLQEVGSSTTTSITYAFMEYNGTDWLAKEGTALKWPWNATTATFEAYFIPGMSSAMKAITESKFFKPLSEISHDAIQATSPQDPLKATYTDVAVGSAVYLQFDHLCTKLTFINLDNVTTNQEIYITTDAVDGLNDHLVFERATNNVLTATFDKNPNATAPVFNKVEEGNTVTYLLPAIAKAATIKLAFKDHSSYHSVKLPDALTNGLEAGKHYKVDITKLSDSYMDDAFKEEQWNQGATSVTLEKKDINAYLTAIRDGDEFIKNGTQVLQKYEENGVFVVAQLVDVDFKSVSFTSVNLSKNIIFQGNNHLIKNIRIVNPINENVTEEKPAPGDGSICGALFGKNEGTIKNLVLEGVTTDFYTIVADDKTNVYNSDNLAYIAALAGKNAGTIQNVKIKFATGNVINAANKLTSGDFYQGALVGYNTGTIEKVVVSGAYSVEVSEAPSGSVSFVGGLLGGTSKLVTDCRIQAASTSLVKVSGAGAFSVGGFTGNVAGSKDDLLSESSTNMLVDATEATGTIYAGGFTGNSAHKLEACSATGSVTVKAGSTVAVGGFIGKLDAAILTNCHASGDIKVETGMITTPYIGGFAGWVDNSGLGRCTLLNCSAVGAVPTADVAGFISKASEGDQILNSFSVNKGRLFTGTTNSGTVTNCHHNGDKKASDLNAGAGAGKPSWLEWTDTPAIYGTDIPYLKR